MTAPMQHNRDGAVGSGPLVESARLVGSRPLARSAPLVESRPLAGSAPSVESAPLVGSGPMHAWLRAIGASILGAAFCWNGASEAQAAGLQLGARFGYADLEGSPFEGADSFGGTEIIGLQVLLPIAPRRRLRNRCA